MTVFRFYLILIFVFFAQLTGVSQPPEKLGVAANVDYSFAGPTASISLHYFKNQHNGYFGVKYPLKFIKGGFQANAGLLTGYRYIFNIDKKLNPFVNLDYQFLWQDAYRLAGEEEKYNYLHQVNFAYGISYRVASFLSVGHSIGAGIYIQNLYSRVIDNRKTFLGYDGIVRFFVLIDLL